MKTDNEKLVCYILIILGALFLRKSFDSIAERTKVDLFRTTGLVYLIGAVTTIFIIGFFNVFSHRFSRFRFSIFSSFTRFFRIIFFTKIFFGGIINFDLTR